MLKFSDSSCKAHWEGGLRGRGWSAKNRFVKVR